MKRNLIEGQAIDNVDEILGYDRELRMYYYWMVRPQIKIVLEIIRKIYKRRKENLSILDIGCGTARVPIGVVERERESK